MSAPDFYFAINALFRHIHERYGHEALVDYWRAMAREYDAPRIARWQAGGWAAVADDWRAYFAREPNAEVDVVAGPGSVALIVRVCPAIKHLRHQGRDVVPYFCEHCDHTCGAMAEAAGFQFQRSGGRGSCRQRFFQIPAAGREVG